MPTETNAPTTDSAADAAAPTTSKPVVVIYSTPTCHFCGMAKEFFKANNIQYTEHDVAKDIEQRKIMIEKSGQMGVPVITVGENIVVGFDEGELRTLLGL